MKNLLSDLAKTRNDLCLNNVTNTIKEQLPDKQKHILKRILLGESEQKIATSLFNTGPSGRSFQLAKSQLIDQLLYMIPYINGGDKIQKEKLKVYRYLTAVRVFELFGLQSLLVRVANKTLKKCETYHMWYEATHLARLLSTHYAVFDIDIKKAENYN
ncbi:MAG: hypothetical protein KJN84_12120, partial [Bacteroidia bacterium]|nr:hypothetical protein [Bacteroidia bacterium]